MRLALLAIPIKALEYFILYVGKINVFRFLLHALPDNTPEIEDVGN